MRKREYKTEEEYRAAVHRDNEMLKAGSTLLLQLGGALLAGVAAGWWFETVKPWALASWFVGSVVLIVIGFVLLKALQVEG